MEGIESMPDKSQDSPAKWSQYEGFEAFDGIELSDEDLEYVVGGLSVEAAEARTLYLQQYVEGE
jgi:hypothetical protein